MIQEVIERVKKSDEFYHSEENQIIIQALEELEQYRALGTVEELKEAMEKQIPKKPIYKDYKEDDEGEKMIPYKAECPTCGYEFEFGTWNDEDNHHCKCGQAIDWEEGGTSD